MAKDISPAHRALRLDLERYKLRTSKDLIAGLLLLGVGALLLFVSTPSPDVPKTGWLYERFGEQGPIVGSKVFGVLAILIAIWVFWRVRQRMTVGVRALEARSRKALGLPVDEVTPNPPQTMRLLAILVTMLVLIGLYYLFSWFARTH